MRAQDQIYGSYMSEEVVQPFGVHNTLAYTPDG